MIFGHNLLIYLRIFIPDLGYLHKYKNLFACILSRKLLFAGTHSKQVSKMSNVYCGMYYNA